MKSVYIGLCLPLILLISACGDTDILDGYLVKSPRILAVKTEDPEAAPQDVVSMRMLVGGQDIDQEMTATILWGIDDTEMEYIGESQYNDAQDFEYQIPADALGSEQWYDLPILARIEIDQKPLNAYKTIRITQDPRAKNPVITGVRVRYSSGADFEDQTVVNGADISLPASITNVALTALTQMLPPEANQKLVYRWYISLAKDTDGILYIQDEGDKIEALLGKGAEAAEDKPSAVLSLNGEESDDPIQTGIYDVYLVVRDNAENSQSLADERHGTDFIYFTLCVGDDC